MTTSFFRRLGVAVGVAALTGGGLLMSSAPASAGIGPAPLPPMDCGMVIHENGPLSSLVHKLEPPLPAALGGYTVANLIHGINCTVVVQLEYATGLQERPQF